MTFDKWPTKELRKLAKTYREKEEMREKKEQYEKWLNKSLDNVKNVQERIKNYNMFAEMIPLDRAAEVLAKRLHQKDSIVYSPVSETIMQVGIWEDLHPEEKQQYINEAIEELKK